MEQRSGKNKKDNSTKVGCLGCLGLIAIIIIIVTMIFSTPNSKNNSEKQDYTQSNTEVKDAKEEKTKISVEVADKSIKQIYSIDNFIIKDTDSSFKVTRLPDDKNSETGEIYKNVYSVRGEYTWQDKIYHFTMLYSQKNAKESSVLLFTSNIDDSKTINVPLESDK